MIPLLPYQRLVFESPLSQEEVIRRLTLEVAKPRSGLQWLEKRTEKFEGTVSAEGFQINRIIRYRNSFLPIIHGRFFPLGPGVRIEMTLKLHIAVLVFSLIWLGFVGRMAITVVPQMLTTGSVDAGGAIVGAMLIFFYLLVTIAFGIEADKARKLLSHIFEADDSPVRKPNMN
jgi:hypothetical protein